MLDTRLKTLLKLVETKSYTKTAEILFITQPAVTHHIKSLEKQNNIKLFSNSKTFRLSPAGQIIFEYAQRSYESYKQLELALSSVSSPKKRMNIASTQQVCSSYLSPIISAWLLKHFKEQLILNVESYQTIISDINEGQIDFAIIDHCFDKSKYDVIHLNREPIILAACPKSIYLEKSKLKVDVLKDAPIIIDTFDSGIRMAVESQLTSKNIPLTGFSNLIEISDINLQKEMVKNNQGIGFFYHSSIEKELSTGSLVMINLIDWDLSQDFYFICSNDNLLKSKYRKIAEEFADINKEIRNL